MSKNIVIVILVVLVAMFMMYAFVQKSEADKQFKRAENQRLVAEQSAAEAVRAPEECKATQKAK